MKKIKVLFIFFIALLFGFTISSKIDAKTNLKTINVINLSGNENLGSISLYDDYSITYTYKYKLMSVEIWVCSNKDYVCDKPVIVPGLTYTSEKEVSFSFLEHIDTTKEGSYTIKAKGHFNYDEHVGYGSVNTLTYDLKIEEIKEPTNDEEEEILTLSQKIANIFYTWVIPGIYIMISVLFVVKFILLCIDLVKYSDNHDVRKEKIKAFVYMFVGLLVVGLVNMCAGFIIELLD